MKRSLLYLATAIGLFSSIVAEAQNTAVLGPRLLITGPSSVNGFVQDFNYTNTGTGATGDWGRAIDSLWLHVPLVKAVTTDSLACGGTPSNIAGKWVLIRRGNCTFTEKAHNAELGGAVGVIIANRIPGDGSMGMANTASVGVVTIPVLSVSTDMGDMLYNALNAGQSVDVTLTDWGFNYTNDLAFVQGSQTLYHAGAIPYAQLASNNGDPIQYNSYDGGIIANTGTSNQTNIKLKQTINWTPQGGSTTLYASDSVTLASLNAIDSTDVPVNTTSAMQLHASQAGTFTYNYALSSSTLDQLPEDNSQTYTVLATDSIFSKGGYDLAAGKPIVTGWTKFASTTNEMLWGPFYFIAKGGYEVKQVQYSITNGDTAYTLPNHEPTFSFLFKFTDANEDKIMETGELSLQGLTSRSYAVGDSNGQVFTVNMLDANGQANPVFLEDNSTYWLAVECGTDLRLGMDYRDKASWWTRSVASEGITGVDDYYAPQYIGNSTFSNSDTVMLFPFNNAADITIDSVSYINSKGIVPNVAMRVGAQPTGIGKVNQVANSLQIYPNPATNQLTIKVPELNANEDKVIVRMIDGLGRIVYKQYFAADQEKIDINTSGLANGQYYVILSRGAKVATNTVIIAK